MNTDTKHKYIIIDDHPLIRNGIRDFIQTYSNFEFIGEFSDAREVLNSTFGGRPDAVILDLNLGNINGGKYCSLIKQKFPKCKIIAFTQYEGKDKELMSLGFDGYVVKSERDLLIEALFTVLNGNKYFKSSNKIHSSDAVEAGNNDFFLKIQLLTRREIEVARYIVQEFSNREIAEKMCISESTVETHRKHIKEKLKPGNRREFSEMLKGI